MEKIDKHISELLFDHDCVIVPSLGGFLASNETSRLLLPNQSIFPPYRRIAFNVYLKQNDGLLANHLVEAENIPYSEALRIIESFANECFESLDSGKKVNIADVGTLLYDKEKNIQFEAVRNFNHLKDSFGMEAVHFLPIQRDEKVEKPKTKKITRPSIPAVEKKSFRLGIKGKTIIGVAVLGSLLIWFSLNLYLVAPNKYESTSLNPFDSQEAIITHNDSIRNMPQSIDTTVANDTTGENQTVIGESETHTSDTGSVEVAVITTPVVIPPDTQKTTIPAQDNQTQPQEPESVSGARHYIIAGVFKVRENAQATLLRLQQLGFTNAGITESNGMNYVSYSSCLSWSEAQALADSLKNQSLEGWIWKH